jgi:hypothetical protein
LYLTAEARWFYQDECPANLHLWFCASVPAPGGGNLRIDEYLRQPCSSEVSIKMRGGGSGFEIKGLIAVLKNEAVPFAPYIELWGKWRLQASALKITERTIVRKLRWLRTYDASRDAIVEIPLGVDEKPVNRQPLPPQGVNVEIAKIEAAEDTGLWWTLGFEAFGDLDSARGSLQKTVQFLLDRSFEVPRSGEFLNYPRWLSGIKT